MCNPSSGSVRQAKLCQWLLLLATAGLALCSHAAGGEKSLPAFVGIEPLISTGAVWRYLDNGSNQGTNWQQLDFDDSAWTNGPAQLGFGDGDEARVINGGPAAARFVTTYFRHGFILPDATIYTNLLVRLLRDDGGVVYLNGVEIFRSNMPTGAVLYTTLASANALASDETTNFYSAVVNAALLRDGSNVVAVEIHQNSITSSDLSFDLALIGNFANTPPVVTLTAPANGAVFKAGTNITLSATALDSDSAVASVEFRSGSTLLATDSTSPYSFIWSNVLEGVYALTAVATDTLGAGSTSAVATISVVTNLPPIVAITSPTNNQVFGGPLDVSVTATASDSDGTVALVELFQGTNRLGQADAAPFNFTWNSVALGLYALTAVATDNFGASRTSAPVNVTVRTNALPAVSITSPASNAVLSVFSNLTIVATATDTDGGIRKVEFYEDSHLLGEDPIRKTNNLYSFVWTPPAPGAYTLRAVASDLAGGARTSAPVQIQFVTNLLPVVAIVSPLNNALLTSRTPLTVKVEATDADGAVAMVELFQDDNKIGERTGLPFEFVLSDRLPGHYTFRARATDNAGDATLSATVNVTLDNRVDLVSKGSLWKYLATNLSQGTAWRDLNYDDSFWPAGHAQLGYGDGDEATVVPFGPSTTNRYITTYFRQSFVVSNAAVYSSMLIRLLRDDGGVAYLNGVEIFRSNMPTNEILYATLASANALTDDETVTLYSTNANPALLRTGTNVLAVEIHQSSVSSSDLSFDAELRASDAPSIVRGPYLQLGTPTSVVVRWRTDARTDSRVRFGRDAEVLDRILDDPTPTNEHVLTLTGLDPDTRYFYDIGTTATVMAGGMACVFHTAPLPGPGRPTRIWVLGDSGTGDANARSVRDAYYNFSGNRAPDLWLMLGDNAYDNGTEAEFQNALFDMYPTMLQRAVLWPILSNHDTANSTNPPLTIPYFNNFTLPTNGEAGGLPSHTEKYYSFDYGNAHFVCLDSQTSLNSTNAPMLDWLRQDLAANQQNWLIVTCANPPYGHVGNDTDTMPRDRTVRTQVLPILEAHGVDLFFAGDDHGYERSYLLDGHYGVSSTLSNSLILDHSSGNPTGSGPYLKQRRGPVPHQGAVYVVAGSSGHLDPVPASPHPANHVTKVILGSVVLDVTDTRLDVRFLSRDGAIEDHFAIDKNNFAPEAAPRAVATDEDTPALLPLDASDREGAALTLTILNTTTNGATFLADGSGIAVTNGMTLPAPANLRYEPLTNFHGPDGLIFMANDGFNDSAPAAVAISVAAVNDVPAADAQTVMADEDTAIPLTLAGSDADGDSLTFAVVLPPAHGTLSGSPPDIVYQPAANFHGMDSFRFQAGDGQAVSAPATVNITVLPVNDAPVAHAQSVTVNEDTPSAIQLTGSDVDGDALSFAVLTQPAHGVLSGSGAIRTYAPALNYHGPDSFTFSVNDGQAGSAPATIQLTVASVNDLPVAVARVLNLVFLIPGSTNGVIVSPNNTNGLVSLDASLSHDVENDPLTFAWFLKGAAAPFAQGVRINAELPVGRHTVMVAAEDGQGTGFASTPVEVITPGAAVEELILFLNGSGLARNRLRPLLASLKATGASFDRGNFNSGANQLHAFENKIRAQVAPSDPALASALNMAIRTVLDAMGVD